MKKQELAKKKKNSKVDDNGGNAHSDDKDTTTGSIVTQDMTFYCFDVLIAKLNHLPPPNASHFTNDPFALFVTWKKGADLSLRGCIGTFSPIPLHEGLQEFAWKSATRDSRFSPIQSTEVKHLQVTVSLLTPFEDGKDYMDWTIGLHGIEIEFMDSRGHTKSATFLPEVAQEQGWTQIETIDALLRKGGFEGPITPKVRDGIKLKRYRSERIATSYEEYERIRRAHNNAVFHEE